VAFTLDSVYPLVEFGNRTEKNYANVSANSIYVNVSITETNFKNITYLLWNSSSEVNKTVYTIIVRTINWTSLSYTNYTYNVSVCDTFNQCNTTETRLVNLSLPPDTSPPLVTIVFPTEGVTYGSSDIPLNFDVGLNEDGGAVEYSLNNGVNNITMDTTDNRNYNASNSSIADGNYVFRVYANDTLGNRNDTESVSFSVDTSVSDEEPFIGGGGFLKINFSVSMDLIDIRVRQGETEKATIVIENTGNTKQRFNLNVDEIKKFVSLSEKTFMLPPGESREISVYFFTEENEPPNIHAGRIVVKAGSVAKSVNIVLEIKQKFALFDVISELKDISLIGGQKLNVKIDMEDIGDLNKKVDVVLEYFIEDFKGYKIKIKEETLGVYKIRTIERKITLPEGLEPGNYLFHVKLTYLESIATTADRFVVIEEVPSLLSLKEGLSIVAIILIIAFLFLIFLITYSKFKRRYFGKKLFKKKRHFGKRFLFVLSEFKRKYSEKRLLKKKKHLEKRLFKIKPIKKELFRLKPRKRKWFKIGSIKKWFKIRPIKKELFKIKPIKIKKSWFKIKPVKKIKIPPIKKELFKKEYLKKAWSKIKHLGKKLFKKKHYEKDLVKIKHLEKKILKKRHFERGWSKIGYFVKRVFKKVGQFVKSVFKKISHFVKNLFKKLFKKRHFEKKRFKIKPLENDLFRERRIQKDLFKIRHFENKLFKKRDLGKKLFKKRYFENDLFKKIRVRKKYAEKAYFRKDYGAVPPTFKYTLISLWHKIYVVYLRAKYASYLIRVKYKVGVHDNQIATIKHIPANIWGKIKRAMGWMHTLLIRIRYRIGLRERQVLTIKHSPSNVLGTFRSLIDKIEALYLRIKYRWSVQPERILNEQRR
jgi:hypothetical protein